MSDVVATNRRAAAFFDVDGTLTKTTIVHYYVYLRRKMMSPFWWPWWHGTYLIKCLYYLVLDKIDRSRLNIVFYRSYAGLPIADVRQQAPTCFRELVQPRCFEQGLACVAEHRRLGQEVVLVTGSIDFLVEPLAKELAVTHLLAPSLIESNGRFTGELNGPPVSDEEKARRIRAFAETHQIDLSQSYAYGDSMADLPMLEAVGFPQAVNADGKLTAIARARGWPTHDWTLTASPKRHRR